LIRGRATIEAVPAESLPPAPPEEVRRELDQIVAGLLAPLCWVLAALYTLYVVSQALAPTGPGVATLLPTWAGGALLFVGAGLTLRRYRVPPQWAHALLAGTAAIVMVNSIRVLLLGGPAFTPVLLLVMVGYATLALNRAWVGLLVAICLAAFAVVTRVAPPDPDWEPMGFIILSGAAIALLTQSLRVNAMRRLVVLRIRERQAATERQQRAEQGLRARLLNTAAHELATPLTPIAIEVHNLGQGENLTPAQRRSVETLRRNFDRLNRVVQNIQEYARPLAGIAVARARTDLSALVEAVAASERERAQRKGVRLETAIVAGLTANVDAARMRLAVGQVLDNALKFAPPETAIRIGLAAQDHEQVLRIEDQGPGIAPAELTTLFEPLAVEASEETRVGAHLGLHVARRILQAHEGSLEVESEPGRGTRVTMRLPAPQTN
jgi:signal transduction histidine kinase